MPWSQHHKQYKLFVIIVYIPDLINFCWDRATPTFPCPRFLTLSFLFFLPCRETIGLRSAVSFPAYQDEPNACILGLNVYSLIVYCDSSGI